MPTKRTLPLSALRKYDNEIRTLKAAFDLVIDHVVVTDTDAHILYANKAAELATGYTLKEMLGRNPADLWGGNMPRSVWEDAWRTMKKKKESVALDVLNTNKDGTDVWQSIHMSPVLDKDGKLRFFIGIEPNITQRKQQELFREHFLSILGHKALGPITSIHWIIELLCERKRLPKEHRAHLLALYDQSKMLTSLLTDLLFVSRMGRGHPKKEHVDLRRALRETLTALSQRHKRHFSYNELPSACPLTEDPSLVRELLLSIGEDILEQTLSQKPVTVILHESKKSYRIEMHGTARKTINEKEDRPSFMIATLIARHLEWPLRQQHRNQELRITLHIPIA